MPRTVVPSPTIRGKGGTDPGDGFPEKLAKYVPAETLAFFVPTSAALGDGRSTALVVVTCVALAGSVGYLFVSARKLGEDERPTVYFYVLAGLAFLGWCLGTSANVADLVGIDNVLAGVILAVTIFAIPLLDEFIASLSKK